MSATKDQGLLRHVLSGTSILDWPELHLKTEDEVKSFLQINEYQLRNPSDLKRLQAITREAMNYLTHQLALTLPSALHPNADIQSILLGASQGDDPDLRRSCCRLLKVMN